MHRILPCLSVALFVVQIQHIARVLGVFSMRLYWHVAAVRVILRDAVGKQDRWTRCCQYAVGGVVWCAHV